jgi:DNA-binding response OmpR family regulator
MHTPPRILIVDDQLQNVEILQDRLEGQGYDILTATAGEQALAMAMAQQPDLILLDVMMPDMDGLEVCRRLKANVALPFMPVIMLTARSDVQDIVTGFEAGADEYLTKPLDQAALIARIKSMLRLKAFHDRVCDQATQLEAEAAELAQWNETLEGNLHEQMTALERMGLLKRFLPPQLAEWVVSLDDATPLKPQQREITVLCCALQGFATFVDTTAPDVVASVLKTYYQSVGPILAQADGTLERFDGDQLVVVFNAPLTCNDPKSAAVDMALAMRQALEKRTREWRSQGYAFDFGIGVAHGEATLGMMDLEGRWDYAVMGSVRQLAACLCEAAPGGQVLINQSVQEATRAQVHTESVGACVLGKPPGPLPVFKIL